MQVSLELFMEFSVAIAGFLELFARIAIYIRVFLLNGIPGGGEKVWEDTGGGGWQGRSMLVPCLFVERNRKHTLKIFLITRAEICFCCLVSQGRN